MKSEKAYFAGGCFWCLEASFRLVPGVLGVISGYTGGHTEDPKYEQVSQGITGHAETVEITYDPGIATYEDLLAVFFELHDPSQQYRQGNDVGTQYRSAIYYTNDTQRKLATNYLSKLSTSGHFAEIYTETEPLARFWPAEEHHQGYFEKHPGESYCQLIVRPKVEKISRYLETKHDKTN